MDTTQQPDQAPTQQFPGLHAPEAGPSRLPPPPPPPPESVVPAEYLVQPGNFKPSPLSGQMDLISLFGLMPMYDTFLRPYLPDSVTVSGNESSGKGKEKAVEPAATASSSGGMKITFGGIKIGEVELDNKPKKLKVEKHYSSLVRDIPGRNNIKKDHFLRDLVLNPDHQPPHIAPLDEQSLREGFALKPGQIPGFDTLIWESNTEMPTSKKKKKRKHHDGSSGLGGNGSGQAAHHQDGEDEHRRKKAKRRDGGGGGGQGSP